MDKQQCVPWVTSPAMLNVPDGAWVLYRTDGKVAPQIMVTTAREAYEIRDVLNRIAREVL